MTEGEPVTSSRENSVEGTKQRTIPVYEETRDRVRQIKGTKSYDAIISEWVDRYGKTGDPDCQYEP